MSHETDSVDHLPQCLIILEVDLAVQSISHVYLILKSFPFNSYPKVSYMYHKEVYLIEKKTFYLYFELIDLRQYFSSQNV